MESHNTEEKVDNSKARESDITKIKIIYAGPPKVGKSLLLLDYGTGQEYDKSTSNEVLISSTKMEDKEYLFEIYILLQTDTTSLRLICKDANALVMMCDNDLSKENIVNKKCRICKPFKPAIIPKPKEQSN